MEYKKKIICSGSNGFIGSSLKKFFGDSVIFYDFNKDYQKISQNSQKYDAFINLATSIYPSMEGITTEDILNDLADNTKFYDFYLNNNVDKFIFVSSAGAMGTVSSNDSTYLKSFYANNKYFLENLFRLNDKSQGLYILRCTNIYGPKQVHKRNHGIIPLIIKSLENNHPIKIWGNGEIQKNFLYIDDFSRLIFKIIECKEDKHGTYNVGHIDNHTINNLLSILQDVSQKNLKIEYSNEKPTDNSLSDVDISLVSENFDWKPEISLKDGIRKIYDR